MPRFVLDEMLSSVIAVQLGASGHDVVAIHQQPDLRGISDSQVLELSATDNRIVVTTNIGDFVTLDRLGRQAGKKHTGIILISTSTFPQDKSFIGAIVTALDAAARSGKLPRGADLAYLSRN